MVAMEMAKAMASWLMVMAMVVFPALKTSLPSRSFFVSLAFTFSVTLASPGSPLLADGSIHAELSSGVSVQA